jgi:hypothetical protein
MLKSIKIIIMTSTEGDSIHTTLEGGYNSNNEIEVKNINMDLNSMIENDYVEDDNKYNDVVKQINVATGSGRVSKKSRETQDCFVYETTLDEPYERYNEVHSESSDLDVMYYHELLCEADMHNFMGEMTKEI